jgi:hypothetical protein
MKVELENVRIVGPVVEAITPDIVKKFIREKIEDMTPSEKLAYGVVGDAIVVIPIIKGATGVIKQAGEWVVVGKDIAGGAKGALTGTKEIGGKLKDTAKGALGKGDEFHSKTKVEKVDVASVVKSDILDKHFGGEIKLWQHEGKAHGGHTKELHVGLSEKDLKKRIVDDPSKKIATTYPSEKVAESVITEVIMKNEVKIHKWLKTSDEKLIVSGNTGKEIGYGITKDGSEVKLTKGAVILIKTKEGIKILTSHPIE